MSRKARSSEVSRRTLLKGAAAAFAALGTSGTISPLLAADDIPTATADPVKFAGGPLPKGTVLAPGRVIGVGGQGFGAHVKGLKAKAAENNLELIACCDLYTPRLERARKEMTVDGAPPVQAEKDYRRLLDNKDLDAVVIATPEHWH